MCLKQKFKISFSEPIAFVLGKYSLIIHYLDMVNLRTAYLRVFAFASSGRSLWQFSPDEESIYSNLSGHLKHISCLENERENLHFPHILAPETPSRSDKRESALNHGSSLQGVLNRSRLEKGSMWRLPCLPVIPFLKISFWVGVSLIYSAMIVSDVWTSESVYTDTYTHSFWRLLSHIGHDKVWSALYSRSWFFFVCFLFFNIESNH